MWRIYDARKKLFGKCFKIDDELIYQPLARSTTSSTLSEIFIANPVLDGGYECNGVSMFTYSELAKATNNFKADCLIGESYLSKMYKGRLERTNQVVVINKLSGNVVEHGDEDYFLAQVSRFSLLDHSNIITLIGYNAEGDHRFLVYEYMPLGSLKDNLHDLPPDMKPLDWNTRMEIAAAVAKALEYLHDEAKPPVLCHNLNSSTILLDEDYHPKLSGFGFPSRLVSAGYTSRRICPLIVNKCGYIPQEYAITGQLTSKSDVYSFGVVLLEIITGKKAIDDARGNKERALIVWARPLLLDRKNYRKMADPMLQGQYPRKGLYQALDVAAMCLEEQRPDSRPRIAEVVTAMTSLASQKYEPDTHPVQRPSLI